MPALIKKTIAEQLSVAQVAIANALKDAQIQKALAGYGYGPARIKEGQKLLEAARSAVSFHKNMAGGQQAATAQLVKAYKHAIGAYQALAKTARAVWLRDRARLAALGISGAMPKSTAGFITAAYTLFDNAIKSHDKDLAEYGYNAARLAAERAKVEAFDMANQAQEAAKGSAQVAAHSQREILRELDAWTAKFLKIAKVALRDERQLLEKLGVTARGSKTKAQRKAPAKARATRAAKKQTTK